MKTPTHRKSLRTLLAISIALIGVPAPSHAVPVALQNATATYSQYDLSLGWPFSVASAINGTAVDGLAWGIAHYTNNLGTHGGTFSESAAFETTANIGFASGSSLTFNLIQAFGAQHTIGRFRLSVTTDDRSTFADGLINGGDVTANWTVLNPNSFTSANGATLTKLGDFSILASGFLPDTDTYTVTAPTTLTGITGIRLELLEDASLPFNGPGRQPENGNLKLSEFTVDIVAVPEPTVLALVSAGSLLLAARAKQNRDE